MSAVINHQSKYYHIPIVAVFSTKVTKIRKRIPDKPSFLYERANWDEFKIKLDQELIDYAETQLDIEQMSNKIAIAIKNASESAIPKSKPSTKSKTNYPIFIVNLIGCVLINCRL